MKRSREVFYEIRQLELKQELENQRKHERNRAKNRD